MFAASRSNHIVAWFHEITQIEVAYDTVGMKKIGTCKAATLEVIEALVPGYSEEFDEYRDNIKGENDIKSLLFFAEKNLLLI